MVLPGDFAIEFFTNCTATKKVTSSVRQPYKIFFALLYQEIVQFRDQFMGHLKDIFIMSFFRFTIEKIIDS